jgi:hypothetical protein
MPTSRFRSLFAPVIDGAPFFASFGSSGYRWRGLEVKETARDAKARDETGRLLNHPIRPKTTGATPRRNLYNTPKAPWTLKASPVLSGVLKLWAVCALVGRDRKFLQSIGETAEVRMSI